MCDHPIEYTSTALGLLSPTKMVFDDVKRKRVLKASLLPHCWRQIDDVFILRKFLLKVSLNDGWGEKKEKGGVFMLYPYMQNIDNRINFKKEPD